MSAQPDPTLPVIRAMRHGDIDAIIDIESRAYGFPWTRQIFADCLMAGYHAIVLDAGGRPVGYAILSVAAAEAHILNLCVHPDWQGRGHGRALLDSLLEHARQLEVERMFLEVRPSNKAAIALYEHAGFVRLGVRKSYYRAAEGREDALVLVHEFP